MKERNLGPMTMTSYLGVIFLSTRSEYI